MAEQTLAIRVRITGRVQGVWYRSWTETEACALGLSGWVRNRRDGSVEALLCGTAAAVEAMVAKLREGPPAARVAEVRTEPAESPAGPGFTVLPTA